MQFLQLTKNLQTYLITQLIKPLGGVPAFVDLDSTVPIEPQLPSAVSVSRELLLASNGVGDIELIGMEEKDGKMLGTSLASVCYLGVGNEGISPVPCMLLAARQIKAKIICVVYSRTPSKTTEFNIATLELDIPTETTKRLDDGSFVLLLKTLHIQTGPEVPVYCAITPSGKCIFGSETRYNNVRLLQHEDDDVVEDGKATPMEIVEESPKKDAYQWSQEGADITVQFQLPENTPKAAINCKFLVDHVILLVQNSSVSYPFRKLWSTIQPDESLWTLEDNTLTLCMTKVDENTRWPQLFDKDDGILETLSDHHLSEIKDRLAKFTSEDNTSSLVPNPSFVQAAQHPAATDMDEDVDDAGEPVVFSVYDRSGNVVDEFNSGTSRWICSSYEAANKLPSVCLQMDVDGLVFTLTEVGGKIQIEHTATFDAFAFVQASKRDARFIHHDIDCHFTSIIESSRNAYLYYHHDDKRLEEVQTLIDLTQGHDTDIIGAQIVYEKTLLVLTESHLVLICLD